MTCDELKEPGLASKNKQFHLTEKETGERDKMNEQTDVSEGWYMWQRLSEDSREEGGRKVVFNKEMYRMQFLKKSFPDQLKYNYSTQIWFYSRVYILIYSLY